MQEIFKDIIGYEGRYKVSNHGRIKSLARLDRMKRIVKEMILKPLVNSSGYYVVNLSNGKPKPCQIHQLEAIAFLNHKPCGHKVVVDHKDFDRLNNYLPNLRLISNRENSNRKHLKSTSKYVGVHWDKKAKKWLSKIQINGKRNHLGSFTDELEASNAYKKALKNI